MITEVFLGKPEALVEYLNELGATTIHHVIPSHEKGKYIIIYS